MSVARRSPLLWPVGLLLVTLLGTGLRFWQLELHRIWMDEAFVAAAALRSPAHLWLDLPRIEPHPPLYFLLEHWIAGVAGLGPASLRGLSAVVGSALIPLSMLLLRPWIGRLAAGVAGIGIALNPLLIWYAQEARMYALLGFELVVALYALERAAAASRPAHLRAWLGLSAVVEAAALFTHYLGALVPLAALLLLLVRARPTSILVRSWLVAQAAVLAAWLPWVLFWGAVLAPGLRPESPLGLVAAGQHVARLLFLGPALSADSWPSTRLPVITGFWLLSALTWLLARRSAPGARHVALGGALGLVVAVVLALRAESYTSKALVLFVPLLLGVLAAPLARAGRTRWPLAAALVSVLAFGSQAGLAAYFDPTRYAKWYSYEPASQIVSQRVDPADLLVEADLDPSFRYYVGLPSERTWVILPHARAGQDEVLWTERAAEPGGEIASWSWSPRFDTLPAEVESLSRDYDRLWLVLKPTTAWWDSRDAVRGELIRQLWSASPSVIAGDATLRPFLTARGLSRAYPLQPAPTFPSVQLTGAACRHRPDGGAEVALAWLPQSVTARPLTVFVHGLVGDRLITQHDGPPAAGRLSSTTWAPGVPFVDLHVLPPSAALETLLIGWYDPTTSTRELLRTPSPGADAFAFTPRCTLEQP